MIRVKCNLYCCRIFIVRNGIKREFVRSINQPVKNGIDHLLLEKKAMPMALGLGSHHWD